MPNDVDNAQGYRHRYLKETKQDVWYVFTDLPMNKSIERYQKTGIPTSSMISPYHYFCGQRDLGAREKMDIVLQRLCQEWKDVQVVDWGTSKGIFRQGMRVAELYAQEGDTGRLAYINYYKEECLVRREEYAQGLFCAWSYVTAGSGNARYAKCVRQTFYKRDRQVAFGIFRQDGQEVYVFSKGERLNKAQFLKRFFHALQWTNQDTLILDRCTTLDFTQPLFQCKGQAKTIAVLHSDHYMEEWQDPSCLYLNHEYYYWFKYAGDIHTMVVSTQEQKEGLLQVMERYGYERPRVEVIPAGALDRLRIPTMPRRRYSMVTVSRLDKRKRLDWVILAVVAACRQNPNLTLDIYGTGDREYEQGLRDLIAAHQAEDYIRLMGYADVRNLYMTYEVYLTASLWESFGLTLLEAAASGMAFVGLDVRYGSRQFIHLGENGYLVDFSYEMVPQKYPRAIPDMADKIVEIFQDEDRLQAFSRASYGIAQKFIEDQRENKWRSILAT